MNLAIEIIFYICECLTQLLCVNAYLGKKIKINVKTLFIIIVYPLILLTIRYFHLPTILTIFSQCVVFLYMTIEFEVKILDKIIVLVLNFLTSGAIQLLALFPIYIIMGNSNNEYLLGLCINVLSLILMLAFVYFINVNKFYVRIIKWDKLIGKSIVLCIILYLFIYIRFKNKNEIVVVAYFISALMICVVIGTIFMWQRDRYRMRQKSLELHMHELYGKTFEGMVENIRRRQHDFKNQIAAIYGMHLTSENFDELVERQKQYCDFLIKESRYDTILTKCKDKILAGFLYTKFTQCEKEGLEVKFEICVNDSQCRLATYELIDIIGILLDNALEYEMENKKGGKLYFKIADNNDGIDIICRNKSDYISGEVIAKWFKKGYSTKGENRGIGLYNVKKILDGNGEIIVTNKEIEKDNWIEFKIHICKS